MKKFIGLFMAMLCVATFNMSAFAESTEIQPRAVVCPLCDRGGLIEVRSPETHSSPRYVTCSHGKQGQDEYRDHYATFYKKCTNSACGYASKGSSRVYMTELVKCWGV